jgi:hypothetical protein
MPLNPPQNRTWDSAVSLSKVGSRAIPETCMIRSIIKPPGGMGAR